MGKTDKRPRGKARSRHLAERARREEEAFCSALAKGRAVKRVKAAFMAAVLLLSQLAGMLSPLATTTAYAASTEITFENGGTATLHDDGTLTGTCTVSGNYWDPWTELGRAGTLTMPDGTVLDAMCYEVYIGNPEHLRYGMPCDGTYSFTATPRADGGFFVLVHSEHASLVPGSLQTSFTQRLCSPDYWYAKTTVDVRFTKLSADATMTDGNHEYALGGAEYELTRSTTGEKTTVVLDADGHADLSLAPNEWYFYRETKAPQGYKLDTAVHRFFTGNTSSEEQHRDDPGRIIFTVQKKDSATGTTSAQPGVGLSGATYRVVDANGVNHTVTTDASGVARLSRLPLGQVTITEISAPEGYKLDPTPKHYTVHAGQITNAGVFELTPEDDFKENVVAFNMKLVKYLDTGADTSGLQNPGVGIEFEVVSNTTNKVVATMTTDAEGRAELTGGWYGEGTRNDGIKGCIPYDAAGYTVREVASTVPAGYKPTSWQVTPAEMVDGTTLSYIVDNDRVTSHLQIVKTDAESGQTVPLAGFRFQVFDESGKLIENEVWHPNHAVLDTFETDGSGRVTLPEGLLPGNYTIREVAAASPYLVNDRDYPLVIPSSGDADPVTVVKVSDKQATGEAVVVKTDSETGSKLSGATFKVVAEADVVSPDGRVQAVAGQVMGTCTTGDDGTAKVSGLPLGTGSATYSFVETVAPAGHVLDGTPHSFTVTYEDDKTPVVSTKVEVADAPNELVLAKASASSGDLLPGATIALWDKAAEAEGPEGKTALRVVAQDGAESVTATNTEDGPRASVAELPGDDWALWLEGEDGERIALGGCMESVPAGTYTPVATRGGSDVPVVADPMTLEDGRTYAFDVSCVGPFTFVGCTEGDFEPTVELSLLEGSEKTFAADLDNGTYRIEVDGEPVRLVGPEKDVAVVGNGRHMTVFTGEGAAPAGTYVTALIDDATELHVVTTGDDGLASVKRLGSNARATTYNVAELAAPAGYVVDHTPRPVTVAEAGLIEGESPFVLTIEDEPTKVDVSKVEVTGGPEIPGAKLTVTDASGKVVDEWVSTDEPHRIEALAPGTYTLTEVMTPRTYDMAASVTFEVAETDLVLKVEMVDDPISITGEIDKRQQIADPVADDVVENGDGANRAEVTVSEDGRYVYTVDHRSTSSTWTDEYTVEDPLDAVASGLAELEGVTTGVAGADYDGKMNVWYRTDMTPEDFVDESDANATLSDGHDNPWLSAEENAERLGDDGRVIDYTGWRLWAEGVPTCRSTELSVADLGLAEDEHVTAMRFEYGRVEQGFTSRPGDLWERDDLKDGHDDITAIPEGEPFSCPLDGHDGHGEATEARFAPIALTMRATDAYVPGCDLDNSAHLALYRNGGDAPGLEDSDEDAVTQTPKTDEIEISGKLDKRQQIADPVAEGVVENGDGATRAEVTVSEDGRCDYTLDFQNTSSTWVDEFTVTDEIECAEDGLAHLVGVTTPQAWQDFDGKLNVWYTTDETDRDFTDPSGADQTVDDGHLNEGASRQLSYAGWRLWAEGVDATSATELSVADLDLAEDEHVVAVRFEYGRVEPGFTTREGLWERDDLKDAHDDFAGDPAAEDAFTTDDGTEVAFAPAVLHMEVTDAYVPGCDLDNSAKLYLARFAYGELLEDADEDAVTQTPREEGTPEPTLPETGIPSESMAQTGMGALGAVLAMAGVISGAAWASRRLGAKGEVPVEDAADGDGSGPDRS